MSLIRNKGSQQDFISTWEKQWNFTKLKIPVTKILCDWTCGGPAPWSTFAGCHSCRVIVSGESWSSWKRRRAPALAFPKAQSLSFGLFSWGENHTTYFFQSRFKTKTLSPNVLSQVKISPSLEVLTHQRRFSWLVICSVITCFRKVPGSPVSSGNSAGFMVSVSGVFCLPWSSRDTEFTEEVSTGSSAVEGCSVLRKGKLMRIPRLLQTGSWAYVRMEALKFWSLVHLHKKDAPFKFQNIL